MNLTSGPSSAPFRPADRHNIRHLYADIFWFGALAGSTQAFINVYAARLGANAFQIGLLTAGPATLNLLLSLPAGQWLLGKSFVRVSFWSALTSRLGYVALVFLPWLFAPSTHQVGALIVITLLMSVPATMLAICFNAMFAELIPAEQRADIVGKRNALLAVSMTASALLSGRILDTVVFPLNYQIVFGFGALGALLSTYHLGRLHKVDVPPVPRHTQPAISPERTLRGAATVRLQLSWRPILRNGSGSLLRLEVLRGAFARFMLAYFLFYTFQYFCLPLFPLAYVHVLKITDGTISLGNSLFYATMFLTSLRLSRLATRYGHHKLLAFSAIGLGIYPLLIYLAATLAPLYWVAALVGGIVWSILSASLANRLMERVPETNRPAGMAIHNLALNLGILIGSLAGPAFGQRWGIQPALLVGVALRFLAGFLLILWG